MWYPPKKDSSNISLIQQKDIKVKQLIANINLIKWNPFNHSIIRRATFNNAPLNKKGQLDGVVI